MLALNGALPALASINFPSFKDSKYVFDRAMQLNGLLGLGKNIAGVRNKLAFDRAALALLQGKNLSNAELRAVVQIAGGNMDDLRVINQIARRTEDLAPLRAAVAAGTDFDLLGAAAATSKFSKVLGAAGILGAGYDIFANPGDHHGTRRTADLVADGAGITAGVGAIALGTGMVAAGTAAAAVLAPVVLVAGTAALAYGASSPCTGTQRRVLQTSDWHSPSPPAASSPAAGRRPTVQPQSPRTSGWSRLGRSRLCSISGRRRD